MSWVQRTIIVPSAYVGLARALAAGIGPNASGAGMFVTALSASGQAPATHYVSSGQIQDSFAALLTDAPGIVAASGGQVTQQQAQALIAASDVSAETGFAALSRLGLRAVTTPLA